MGDSRHNPRSPNYRGSPGEQIIGVELQPRVVPSADWIARSMEAKAAGGAVTPPLDAQSDLVVYMRCNYVIPSQFAPQKDWPSVGMDLFELGRIGMVDLKKRVKEALAKEGEAATASMVTITETVIA